MKNPILCDEGVNGFIIREIRRRGIGTDWIMESNASISDRNIIEIAKNQNQVLITEDKDFGEWIFAHGVKGLSIIFLRYEKIDYKNVLDYLLQILDEKLSPNTPSLNEFITINRNKVRRRKID